MENRPINMPLKPMSIQTRLAFSMLYQAKHKMNIAKWMKPRDVVDANPMVFDRIQHAIQHDYGYSFVIDYHWKAVEMLFKGIENEREPGS